jgi:hypothetical protein
MAAPRQGLNPTTNSVGFTAKLVTVRSVSADGSTAVVVDRQNTQTSVPMLVQRSKGPLPEAGDTWLIAQDLGMWTFAAFIGASDSDFAEGGPVGSQVTIGPNPPSSPVKDDVWLNSTNGNQVSSWDGSAWVAAQFGAAALAPASVTAAQMALATITSKQLAVNAGILASQVAFTASQIGGSRVFTGTSQPSGMAPNDVWFDAGSGNAVKVWTGEGWNPLPFSGAAIVAGIINGTVAENVTLIGSVLALQPGSSGGATETWHAASLVNSWAGSGNATDGLFYKLTPTGEVRLVGDVKSPGTASLMTTLPVGYRPATSFNMEFSRYDDDGTAHALLATDGALTMQTTVGSGKGMFCNASIPLGRL